MSYHLVEVAGFEEAELYAQDGQLHCRIGPTHRQVPLEDVAAILVTSPTCTLRSHLLAEVAARRIPLILCQNFRPTAILLPVQRATDTLLTRAQIESPQRLRDALWLKTLDAKCANQLALAQTLAPHATDTLDQIRVLCAQRTPAKEGPCAHLYWDLCAQTLRLEAFARAPAENDGLNALLNYAYAHLLTQTLQTLLATGLDPLYGIGHATRERATPLAYDIMEPFRPLLDAWAFKWLETRRAQNRPAAIDPAYKTFLRQCLAGHATGTLPLRDHIALTVKGLRQAFLDNSPKPYTPWQWKTIKWDGYLSALTSP